MAFSDIQRDNVLAAIDECDAVGRDAFLATYGYGEAKTYHLKYRGNLYDSKAILGVARRYARPDLGAAKRTDFSGGLMQVVPHYERLGFEIVTHEAAQKHISNLEKSQRERSYWWVNHKQTYTQEVDGGYLWSPITRKGGGRNEFYENMKRVQPGDLVFSFANAQIRAVGVCTASALLMPKPAEFGLAGNAWDNEGWQVPVNFSKLKKPLRVKDNMAVLSPTLPEKYSPIRETGDGNQGAYLAAVPLDMADALIGLIGSQWRSLDLYFPIEADAFDDAIEEAADIVERAILNRTDIGETEKLTLVASRRGQGVYRANLERFETACRITGVTSLRHLRASHIKPWSASTNYEKLDGNNGLLLSPHIDHLFDRGYISFTDTGRVLLSPSCDRDTLKLWHIDEGLECGSFRSEQIPYLTYHREFILKRQ